MYTTSNIAPGFDVAMSTTSNIDQAAEFLSPTLSVMAGETRSPSPGPMTKPSAMNRILPSRRPASSRSGNLVIFSARVPAQARHAAGVSRPAVLNTGSTRTRPSRRRRGSGRHRAPPGPAETPDDPGPDSSDDDAPTGKPAVPITQGHNP